MIRAAFCIFAVVVLGSASYADEVKEIKDWGKVVDPDMDCKVKEDAGSFMITIPGKHHDLTYTEAYTKLNAPRILQPVAGDFTLTVIVDFALPKGAKSSGGAHAFTSGGLLLWQDDKNYIRLERAAVSQSEAPFVWVEGFLNGKSVYQGLRRVGEAVTSLKIARQEGKLKFSYDDGAKGEWQELEIRETIEIPFKQAGVAAINSTDREHVVTFTELAFDQKRE